jgi:hypothetical protein
MSQQTTSSEWPVLEPDDPPLDLSREEAAFEKERERLVRDHLGKLVLVHDDEVIGVFNSVDEALFEGYRRFGLVRMIVREITVSDPPEYIPNVDLNHPSVRRIS